MSTRSKVILFLFIVSTSFSLAQNVDSLITHYAQKALKYLDKEKALLDYYKIDKEGVKIYLNKKAKQKDSAEFIVMWNDIPQFKEYLCLFRSDVLLSELRRKSFKRFDTTCIRRYPKPETRNNLQGLRIALDPGHMAGNMEMAKMEKKFIDMDVRLKSGTTQKCELMEAQLTLCTALLLQKKLIDLGAEVMMTRDIPGITAFGITYEDWLVTRFKQMLDSAYTNKDIDEKKKIFLETKATNTEIFRQFFVNVETKERARRINDFVPDLTVVIHYNVDEKNTDWKKPTTKNFCMTFVGGAYMKNEMDKPAARVEFLRLLLTNDIENSVTVSENMINSFEKSLNVPIASDSSADYLIKYSIPTKKKGVYCRNLTLTRLVHGPIVYGETLFQDNENELLKLSFNTVSVGNLSTSARVEQIAGAYFDGIKHYFDRNK